MLVTEAIQHFLARHACPLRHRYYPGMQVGVGVVRASTPCERVDGLRHYRADEDAWYEIDLPRLQDHRLPYDPEKYFAGVSMSGWDYAKKTSSWVAIDIDAVATSRHVNLEPVPMIEMAKPRLALVHGVTTRVSRSGRGLHIYVDIPTQSISSMQEHRNLRDDVFSRMGKKIGMDLAPFWDNTMAELWICHPQYTAMQTISECGGLFD